MRIARDQRQVDLPPFQTVEKGCRRFADQFDLRQRIGFGIDATSTAGAAFLPVSPQGEETCTDYQASTHQDVGAQAFMEKEDADQ